MCTFSTPFFLCVCTCICKSFYVFDDMSITFCVCLYVSVCLYVFTHSLWVSIPFVVFVSFSNFSHQSSLHFALLMYRHYSSGPLFSTRSFHLLSRSGMPVFLFNVSYPTMTRDHTCAFHCFNATLSEGLRRSWLYDLRSRMNLP